MYKFIHNRKKVNEKITMLHYYEDNCIDVSYIGNIFNLIDYLNVTDMNNEVIQFINFTNNEMSSILDKITLKKEINSINSYNSFTISNRSYLSRTRMK